MSEERMRILNMVKEGKITPEEGARLLEALEANPGTTSRSPVTRTDTGMGKSVHIRVTDRVSGQTKVNVAVPLRLALMVKSLIPESEKLKLLDKGIELDTLFQTLDEGTTGNLVNVDDEEHNQTVEVWVE